MFQGQSAGRRAVAVLGRVALDILLIISVLEGWWFIALPLGICGAWAFPYYAEMILAGACYDSLFGLLPGTGVTGYLATIGSVLALAVVAILRRVIRK